MRQDIQCLRGCSIVLVFIFHLLPDIFVNGFLGVDVFFVISGFLMAKNLTHSEIKRPIDILSFYYRRLRRILPLYYLIILLTIVMVHMFLGDHLWANNQRYSLASVFLVTNQLVIHDQADYFNQFLSTEFSINAFLHMWSLSVEVQFYLLVPFIFFGLQFLKNDYLKLLAVSLMTLGGFIAFSMILDRFAFNFMFLRLWQFSAGFMSLFWTKIKANQVPEKLKNEQRNTMENPFTKEDLVTVATSIIGLCLLSNNINVVLLRPLVSMAAAVILGCESKENFVLSSKILEYVGNISYVMYLVHWPLIAIFPPYTISNYVFLILVTLLSSIVLHHIYEKKCLKLGWKSLTVLLLVLLMANIFLHSSQHFWIKTYPPDVQKVLDKNKALIQESWLSETNKDECFEEEINDASVTEGARFGYGSCVQGNGTASVMVIGNSYTMNFRNHIREQFRGNYSSFRYISLADGFGVSADNTAWSQASLKVHKRDVELYKPDVLFIIARYSNSIKQPIQENDDVVSQMNENIKFYEKFTKKIFILGAHPLYQFFFVNRFIQDFATRPDDLEMLHLNKIEADREMRIVKKRFSMVKCTKCQFFDLSHVFLDGEKYLTFDRDQLLSYVDNTLHVTAAGIKKCEPALKDIAMKYLNGV